MALDPTRLATAMRAAILSGGCGAIDGPALSGLCTAIASTVIAEFTAHAVVPAGLLISPGGMSPAPVTGSTTVT